MFLIVPSKATNSPTAHAPMMALGSSTGGSQITVCQRSDRLTVSIVDHEQVAIENGVLRFTVTNLTNNVTAIAIGNSQYRLAENSDNPEPGEYLFDYRSKQAQVYLLPGNSLERESLTYESAPETATVKSTDICGAVEPLLYKWNATAEGLTLNDNWGQLPSGFSFGFTDCESNRSKILAQLGKGTYHTAFNNKWVVSSLLISEQEYTDEITVAVGFSHWLAREHEPSRSPLDKPLKLRQGNYRRSRTLASFAIQAGISYKGAKIEIRIPRETKTTDYTTLRSLLNSRAITAHSWVRYTSKGVELVKWTSGETHVLTESDLKDKKINFNYGGSGSTYNGVKLAVELRNQKVDLDFESGNENIGITQKWTFENCNNLFELYNPIFPDGNGTLRTLGADVLQNPGNSFDRGDLYSRIGTLTYRFNGIPTFQQVIKTGLEFDSSKVYEIVVSPEGNYTIRPNLAISAAGYFNVVSQTVRDWRFNPEDGYLESKVTTGTETSRLKQESENLEAVTYLARAQQNRLPSGELDPDYLAQSQAYQFGKTLLPVNETETSILNLHSNYYTDTARKEDCGDDEYIEPKFERSLYRFRDDKIIEPDPDSTKQLTLPPVVSGRSINEQSRINLTSVDSPQRYEKTLFKLSVEGQNGKDTARDRSTQYFDGKPGIHTRLNLLLDQTNTSFNSNRDRYGNRHYYISSPGVHDKQKINEGSIGFDDIDDPNEVLAIARTQNSIDNTRNCLTAKVDAHYNPRIKKGDFLMHRGKRYKVLDILPQRKIQHKRQTSQKYNLRLGFYINSPLNLEDRTC